MIRLVTYFAKAVIQNETLNWRTPHDTELSPCHLSRMLGLVSYICLSIIMGNLLAGCRGMYEGMTARHLDNCYHLPYPEQQECLRENEANYDRYQLERDEVLKRGTPPSKSEETPPQ